MCTYIYICTSRQIKQKKMMSFFILLHIIVIHQNVKSVQRASFLAESDVS